MFDIIRNCQLDIMLALCSVCAFMLLLLLITRFLPRRSKWVLFLIELIATMLLAFDREAYIYSGDTTDIGYVMVRVSNFMVFFLTSAMVLGFNFYLMDLLKREGKIKRTPTLLKIVSAGATVGMLLIVISQFTGIIYYFDVRNHYHRGPGFLISYIIPVICPFIQLIVIMQHKKVFSRFIFLSLMLFLIVPVGVGVIQIFTYGISIVNMAMVIVSVLLYIFAYLDINDEVVRTHKLEMENLQNERESMKRLFGQTAAAFVSAVEKKDSFSQGHSARVADCARRIAEAKGKSDDECDEVYYAALLHDIGMVGIPDSLLGSKGKLTEEEYEIVKEKTAISGEILSNITEYPYLNQGARYCSEWYDGSGYPEGLKGNAIPEIARIISVADAYDTMTMKKRFRDPIPYPIVREEFIRQSGIQFDPDITEIIVHMIDMDIQKNDEEGIKIEKELRCNKYRASVSAGIQVVQNITRVHFRCAPLNGGKNKENRVFSAPSVILFDSYDKRVHGNERSINAYSYLEYGEIWFDGHYISTAARNMVVNLSDNEVMASAEQQRLHKDVVYKNAVYEITAARFEDHLVINLTGPYCTVKATVALPDRAKEAYIGLTGENCILEDITTVITDDIVREGDIDRIVGKVSYIDRLESDIPNIQIDHTRSAATEGIEVEDGLRLEFHSMSLPSADLVWHCPYIVLFSSEDKRVGGEGYTEYALIKINGEESDDENSVDNRFSMKKNDSFPGWSEWKKINKEGLECKVEFAKRGDKITLVTENLGIEIENTTITGDGKKKIYAALTGDQVALTDIRIRR